MTLRELKELDEEVFDLAIENTKSNDCGTEFEGEPNLDTCIGSAFLWYKSPQDHTFWNLVVVGKIKKAKRHLR